MSNSANVVTELDIGIGEATTTLSGTTIVGRNPNGRFLGKSVTALATAIGDEAAVADADLMFTVWGSIVESKIISLDGLVLAQGQYIQVNNEIETTSGRVAIFAHFDNEIS